MSEETIKKEIIYNGKIVTLEQHQVKIGEHKQGRREIVKHPGAAAILAVESDHVYLVRQYRKALEREVLEIPAGVLEPGEAPYDCAKRELMEELNFHADNMAFLTTFFPSPGYLNEAVHLFLATGLSYQYAPQDEDEALELEKHAINDLKQAIKIGTIQDSKTIISLLFYLTFYQ